MGLDAHDAGTGSLTAEQRRSCTSPLERTVLLVPCNRLDNRPGDVARPRPELHASRDRAPVRPLEGARPTLAAG